MKGASKVIMGATLVMVVSLAIVLGLVLVLLAELYCALLLRRRQMGLTSLTSSNTTRATPITTPATTPVSANINTSTGEAPLPQNQSLSPPFTSFYDQGVLQAPRSLLFPAVSGKENKVAEKISHLHHHVLEVRSIQESNTSPQHIGLIATPSPSTSYVASPHHYVPELPFHSINTKPGDEEHLVYISNPIYDNDASCRPSKLDTPFETPDSSPSRLETGGSSSDDDDEDSEEEEVEKVQPDHQPSPSSPHQLPITPPLTPMKKLPQEACSVSLRDARSLGTSSDSVSNNGISSSSSGSPCTSPSW